MNGDQTMIACLKPVPQPFSFAIKKSLIWLLVIVAVASIERYVWVNYNGPTGDLIWYLDENRTAQYTFLGFDKRHVSFFIDLFSSNDSKLWAASLFSGLMFSLAVFSTNKNRGYNKLTSNFFIIISLLLTNKYFFQLDMHLWRQQIAFYGFIVSINQTRFISRVAIACMAIFFHEITILLYLLYYLAGLHKRICGSIRLWALIISIANTILFFAALKAGYLQVSIISFFCVAMLLTNQRDLGVRRACIFIVLLSSFALFIQVMGVGLGIGVATAERLIFLAVMAGLFLFFTTTASNHVIAHSPIRGDSAASAAEDASLFDARIIKPGVLVLLKVGFVSYYAYVSSI